MFLEHCVELQIILLQRFLAKQAIVLKLMCGPLVVSCMLLKIGKENK